MKQTKIIFFDVDGTLVDMKTKVITEKTKETLNQLQQNGILICLATGRPLPKVPKIEGVEFDATLTFNGSYCTANNSVIFKNPIPTQDVHKIVRNAKAMNRSVSVATLERSGANGTDQDLEDYYAISKQIVDIAEDFDTLVNEEIYQIMMGLTKDDYAKLLDGVKNAEITAWWPRAVDIIPKDGGKGLAVQKVLEYFNLPQEASMAFGDGTNDIEMLKAVGTGIAMGNATDNVKQIADVICGSVEDEGVYQYCKDNHLI